MARLPSLALTTASLVFSGDMEASTRLELQLTWLKGAECSGLCNGAGNARLLLGSRTWVYRMGSSVGWTFANDKIKPLL